MTASIQSLKGGEFLIKESSNTFIPEEFSEEQQEMARITNEFIKNNILNNLEKIEAQEPGLASKLIEKIGELGLLGPSVDEEYGGLGLDLSTALLITDIIGSAGSFSTTYGAHSGIGLFPIVYYGNDAQKKKYVPGIVSGALKSCYCLTEPGSGSDANSGKTKATPTPDGKHYLLNGQKMWITNSGFADIFIVFAKIENDKNLSAFIVEKSFGGIELGAEEKKLGIKGSSTRQVFFKDCKVPVENLLSERENGFKIAVNILNIGRIKLGIGVLGGARFVTNHALQYANDRKQFGVPIFTFGAIKEKLANMLTKIYATESLSYRIGHAVENQIEALKQQGLSKEQSYLKGVEQYSIEAAIAKVYGSESLDYIVDEGVQIYGGMGYSAEAPMERAYRDARISRIYEGTNEINRILSVGMLLRKAMKGEIDILTHVQEVAKELTGVPTMGIASYTEFLEEEKEIVKGLKKIFLLIGGKASQIFGAKIDAEQELLMRLADILIQIYVAESAILRAEKYNSLHPNTKESAQKERMTKLITYEASDTVYLASKEAINNLPKSDEVKVISLGLKRFVRPYNINTKEIRREIVENHVPTEYPF